MAGPVEVPSRDDGRASGGERSSAVPPDAPTTRGLVTRDRREHGVDVLRVVVIAGVVVMHTTNAYLGGADWFYTERTTSTAWSTVPVLVATFGALFGLGPLFLVAGWLSARSLARRGPAAFTRSRLVRLGIPLVVFIYLIDPVTAWLGGVPRHDNPSLASYLGVWEAEAGPMWFVAALLVFSVVYAAVARRRRARRGRSPGEGPVLTAAAATIAVSGVLVWQRWPLDAADTWLNLRWGLWPQGAVLFALGVHAAGSGGLDRPAPALVRRLGWITTAALGVLVALSSIAVARGELQAVASDAPALLGALALLYGTVSVTLTWWLVAQARMRFTGSGGRLSAAGRASYPTYVVHPLVLTAIMIGFASIALPPPAKCLVVAALAVPACFGVGYALTRVPGLSRVL